MGYNERFLQSLRWIRVKVILKKQNSCFISQWSLFKVETLYIKHRNMMLNAKKKKCQNSRKDVSKFTNPVLESTVLSFWNWGALGSNRSWDKYIFKICRDVDRPSHCHTEWSKSERRKQILYINTPIYGIHKKWYRWTYLQNRDTDVENKHGYQAGKGRGMLWIGKLGLTYSPYCV